MKHTSPNVNAELISETINMPAKIFFFKGATSFRQFLTLYQIFMNLSLKPPTAPIDIAKQKIYNRCNGKQF